jgi:hypothetical protein
MILRKVEINFATDKILSTDHKHKAESCLWHMRTEQKNLYDQLGGIPTTIDNSNTTIHQLWWQPDELDFENLGLQLGMKVLSVSSICQPSGCVIPWHRDTFYRIRQQVTPDATIVRANINLCDAEIGHFIQYEWDDELVTYTGWRANQGLLWDSEVSHLGANVGFQDKYTLQVSGILN